MRFYGMSYWELMATPIRAFWALHRNIARISAEEDLRKIAIAISAQSPEGAKSLQKALVAEATGPSRTDPMSEQIDHAAVAALKARLR